MTDTDGDKTSPKPEITNAFNEWCGQEQPHNDHYWAKGAVGWSMYCAGHS